MSAGDLCEADTDVEVHGTLIRSDSNPWALETWDLWRTPDVVRNDVGLTRGIAATGTTLGSRAMSFAYWIKGSTQMADRMTLEHLFDPDRGLGWACFRVGGVTFCRWGEGNGAGSGSSFAFPTTCDFIATDPDTYSVVRDAVVVGIGDSEDADPGGTKPTSVWTCTIPGPVTHPAITVPSQTGPFLISWPGLVVGSGRTLVIDSRSATGAQSALLLDPPNQTSVLNLARDAFSKPTALPSLTNGDRTFEFAADSGGSTATFTYRDNL